jgi:hypothetical protein
MNPDMNPNGMLINVSVSPEIKNNRYNNNLILIRLDLYTIAIPPLP